jgi:hypothetical protein
MSKSEEERIKLLASVLSNLSVTTFAAGIIAPIVSFFYGVPGSNTDGWWFMIGVVWLLAGSALYLLAWTVLGRLK